jgi:hypothetical protein
MFDDLNKSLAKFKELAGTWPALMVMGSFVLYVLGYLSVRFNLTVLGIGTDLAVVDERYIFAGAKFVVYLLATLPIIGMFLLPFFLIYVGAKVLRKRTSTSDAPKKTVSISGNTIAIMGIVISIALVQIVMRKCFDFSNLLIADQNRVPNPLGLKALLLDDDGLNRSLYFSGLVAATLLVFGLLLLARRNSSPASPALSALLVFFVVLQFLFLPINYGIFIMDKVVPKVSDLGNQAALKEGQEAWLVWEGTRGVTYLIRTTPSPLPGQPRALPFRSLVTIPQADVKRIEVIRYDQILKEVFSQ